MQWLGTFAEGFVVALVIALLVVALFAFRRRWLARQGGLFECAVRLHEGGSHDGWVLGVARYQAGSLQWFRVFGLTFRPRLVFDRRDTSVVSERGAEGAEMVLLYSGHQVLVMRGGDDRDWELAMAPESVTGLNSWLEGAPPNTSYPL